VLGGLLLALVLASCGSSGERATFATGAASTVTGPAAKATVVAKVGATSITGKMYAHWMTVGEATVEMPKPTGALPAFVVYEPPIFSACVAHLRASAPRIAIDQLRANCRKMYERIQARILNFLISGYWLRGEAAERGVSVSVGEVEKKFAEERRANYPTAESFHRLQLASRQTIQDLEFAVETQMLSTKLVEKYAQEHGEQKNEQAAVPGFNRSIRSKWIPRTSCEPDYVVADCKQYRVPKQ
jgi:hypothetical protein